MIAFGCAITENDPYWRYAEPGIRRVAEADSDVYAFAAVGSTARSYNLLIDTAAAREDLEALVIVHTHTEIDDPDFCRKVRDALSDPEVGVLGAAGARDAPTIAWWEGEAVTGPVTLRYTDFGGGAMRAFSWADPAPAPAEVDVVGGFLMVLSPWVVRNVRFDEELSLGPGIDVDFCRSVKAAGRKVAVGDLRTVFHSSLDVVSERELWIESHIQLADKWEPRLTGVEPGDVDWKSRARRAEAEREAAHAASYGNQLVADARLVELERRLEEAHASPSWRVTAPLRRLNAKRAEVRAMRASAPE